MLLSLFAGFQQRSVEALAGLTRPGSSVFWHARGGEVGQLGALGIEGGFRGRSHQAMRAMPAGAPKKKISRVLSME